MHCFVCKQQSTAVMAVAICQRCGGAVCEAHTCLVRHPGSPGGMMGLVRPRVEHVCEHCLQDSYVQVLASRKQSDALPDALSIIQGAEALLRLNQRTSHVDKWPRFWQAIFLKLARWFRWGKGEAQQEPSRASQVTTSNSDG